VTATRQLRSGGLKRSQKDAEKAKEKHGGKTMGKHGETYMATPFWKHCSLSFGRPLCMNHYKICQLRYSVVTFGPLGPPNSVTKMRNYPLVN